MGIWDRARSRVQTARSTVLAEHARVADGEHLWLAVRGTRGPLALVRDGAPDLEVPTETETHGGRPLLTAVLPLAALLADDAAPDLELRLVHGRRRRPVVAASPERPPSPTLEAPATADGRWRWSVRPDPATGHVVVRRGAAEPGVPVLEVRPAADGAVEVLLETTATDVTTVAAHRTTLPVVDGLLRVGDVPGLPWEESVPLTAAGRPLLRRRNALERPQQATSLPALPAADLELRWLRDGRLALHRREAPARPLP